MKSSAYWMVALVMAVAAAAQADDSEKVTLRDGSVFAGELVEKVPGDHITLKLATGEIKRIEWAELADKPAQKPAQASAPAGAVHLVLDSTRPQTTLYKLEGGGSLTVSTARGTAYGTFEAYSPVCVAPCEADVDPNGTYKVGGDVTETGTFSLPARSGALALHVDAGSRGMHVGGVWATVLGISGVVGGGLMIGLGFMLTTDTYDSKGNVTATTHSDGMVTAGIGVGIAGVVLLAVGIPLLLLSGTHVETAQGERVAGGHAPRFAFTPNGFVF